jgi:hypothetical protein
MSARDAAVLVRSSALWHPGVVKRTLHRCFVALGLLAMALALTAIPAGIVLASAKADTATIADNADEMPCHHPCPGCAKPCPDMGTCLLKCLQPLSDIASNAAIQISRVRHLVPLALSRRITEAPIPPLLRPPSV